MKITPCLSVQHTQKLNTNTNNLQSIESTKIMNSSLAKTSFDKPSFRGLIIPENFYEIVDKVRIGKTPMTFEQKYNFVNAFKKAIPRLREIADDVKNNGFNKYELELHAYHKLPTDKIEIFGGSIFGFQIPTKFQDGIDIIATPLTLTNNYFPTRSGATFIPLIKEHKSVNALSKAIIKTTEELIQDTNKIRQKNIEKYLDLIEGKPDPHEIPW